MKRILAIAVIAVRSAIRSRVVLAVSALILTILVAGPLTVEGDGTVSGQINITLRYTLTAVSFLLGLVTVWLGCASISMDVQQRQIHLLSTKPVSAMELWLGKWLGLLAVNAGVLTFTGVLTLLIVSWTFQPAHFPQSVPAEDLEEIWRARSPFAPVYAALDEEVARMANERMKAIPAAQRPSQSDLEEFVRTGLLKRVNTVAHQEERRWTFQPLGLDSEIPLRLTYRLSASSLGPVPVAGRWTVSQEGLSTPWQHAVTNTSGRLYSVQIPADPFQPGLPLELSYQNLAEDASTVVFTQPDFRLYTYRHSMAWNLCKALALVFFELAFLGAVGVTAGAVFSLPVAALVSGYVVIMLQTDSYIARMAGSDNLLEGSDGVLEQLMQIVFITLHKLMLLLQDQPALVWLAEGTWIDPRIILYDGLTKLVLYSGLIAFIGAAVPAEGDRTAVMNRPVILAYILISALLFLAAGQFHDPLLEARRTEGLNQTEPIDNAPPLVAFTTVALGGFRGIIADILWIRASRMQNEGRYFELVQLSDWITKLEPRFTTVWAFHAWNMSYNVSVMFPSPEDRWRWVRHGLSLLTEEGLKYNPGAPDLYRELGWIYQHKISATQDNAHWYYKREWGREMNLLLPGGQLEAQRLMDADRFDTDSETRLLQKLEEEFGSALPRRAEDFQRYNEKAAELAPSLRDGYGAFARRHLLEVAYRFSIEAMHALEEKYGSQDWRLPQVHAAYWAIQGQEDTEDFSQIALQRMITQSMADLFLNGGAYLGATASASYPDIHRDALPGAQTAFRDALEKFPKTGTFRSAYKNFLQRAIFEVWLQGEDETAGELHREWISLLTGAEEKLSVEQILCSTLASLYGQESPSFSSIQQAANHQYQVWASRGQLARALRFQSIPPLCL